MEELVPIRWGDIGNEQGIPTVSGRDLKRKLGVHQDDTNWFKAQIERGQFIENTDFIIFAENSENSGRGRPAIEYHFTLDAAKHIAMMSRGEKAKAIRLYFIAVEKQWHASQRPQESAVDKLATIVGFQYQKLDQKIDTKIAGEAQRVNAVLDDQTKQIQSKASQTRVNNIEDRVDQLETNVEAIATVAAGPHPSTYNGPVTAIYAFVLNRMRILGLDEYVYPYRFKDHLLAAVQYAGCEVLEYRPDSKHPEKIDAIYRQDEVVHVYNQPEYGWETTHKLRGDEKLRFYLKDRPLWKLHTIKSPKRYEPGSSQSVGD